MPKCHREAHIYNITHFATKPHMFIMVYIPFPRILGDACTLYIVQQDAGEYFNISSFDGPHEDQVLNCGPFCKH